jgi:ribonuclease HI
MLIACDGSALRKPDGSLGGAIGWAWAREDGHWASNGFYTGTNQRSELLAILTVLLLNPKGPLTVQMDSQYALNVTEKWAYGWAKRNWVKPDGKPVMNRDIIEPIVELRRARKDPIEFQWVKGHRKDNAYPLNTAADKHAGDASQRARRATDPNAKLYLDSKGRTGIARVSEMMQRIALSPHNPYKK